jgi:hypothetical protein
MCFDTCCLGQEFGLVERHRGILKTKLCVYDCVNRVLALGQLGKDALYLGGLGAGVFGEGVEGAGM